MNVMIYKEQILLLQFMHLTDIILILPYLTVWLLFQLSYPV